jgi:hypothetical protein
MHIFYELQLWDVFKSHASENKTFSDFLTTENINNLPLSLQISNLYYCYINEDPSYINDIKYSLHICSQICLSIIEANRNFIFQESTHDNPGQNILYN